MTTELRLSYNWITCISTRV